MKKLGFPAVPTFNIEPSKKEQAKKVLEEASEFVEAVKAFTEHPTNEGVDRMLEEAADVNQALMNALTALNMKSEDLEEAALYCFARNHARGRFEKPKAQDCEISFATGDGVCISNSNAVTEAWSARNRNL